MIHTWYGGNEAGNALADVIFGKISPSGKLPVTFLDRLEDLPSFLSFGSDNGKLYYNEGIFVGYRYFDTVGRDVAFRFGYVPFFSVNFIYWGAVFHSVNKC
jgi:beta-glucosidase